MKQYEQALKAHKGSREVAFDELPTSPGFRPIPVANSAPAIPKPAPRPSPTTDQSGSEDGKPPPTVHKMPTSHQQKQVIILQAKQKQFKMAAINAKSKAN